LDLLEKSKIIYVDDQLFVLECWMHRFIYSFQVSSWQREMKRVIFWISVDRCLKC